ncbi:aldose 1-epimerase family protein [Amycolatopsis rhizosphaerae]|uniref:Aldose 1-epimerase family protein n=1 Tax=Amycolatopsis rhizosphaerae TaxID=2053003 RepID=A0A558DA51_9PSEU|nr:aldose 1-epimerase family protein [Amycolatopsis rhizosphaerae]TVT57843.1 aldose 1-epimerase family protein [Amycolatopsis rhizosphaerae]
MANPTGEQFEITRGAARAVVTEIGAGLRAFEISGVPYVETFDAEAKPPKGAGQVLLPWPNRTKGAEWTYQGEKQVLEVTEEARGNAIHGLTRHREWTLVEHAESSITFEIEIEAQPGWPVPLHARITYDLAPRALTVTHEMRNEGETPIGVGVGTHPYFRLGDVPTDELTLTLPATRVRPYVAEAQLPYGEEQDVEGTEYDFRTPRPVGEVDLDTAFGGLTAEQDGRHHHYLSHEDRTLEVWTDADFRWVQVFTPAELVGRGRAIALEPMTCPADALNSGTDLIELDPGTSWTGSWGIRIHG